MIGAEHEEPFKDALAGARVESGDDQVARERGADGDIGRLLITNLPDNKDLRILAKEMAGGFGEIQTTRFVDLRLHDAGDDLLGRVFDGDNVAATLFREVAEAGVNGGRLAAAGGAGQ